MLNISIFYVKAQWHQLVGHCLNPLLKECLNQKKINGYYLHFSSNQGEHLRLSIATKDSEALKNKFVDRITPFFDRYPSTQAEAQPGSNAFFMDFDNNSLNFNLYRPYPGHTSLFSSKKLWQIRHEISVFMMKHLAKDTVDEVGILSFSFYLHLVMAKEFFGDLKTIVLKLKGMLNAIIATMPPETQIVIDRRVYGLINENQEVFLSTANSIWASYSYAGEQFWLKNWALLCRELVNKGDSRPAFYLQLSGIVHEHINQQKSLQLPTSLSLLYHTALLMKNKKQAEHYPNLKNNYNYNFLT